MTLNIIVIILTVLGVAAIAAGATMLATGQHRQANPRLPASAWTAANDSIASRTLASSRPAALPAPDWKRVQFAACQQNRYRYLLVHEGDSPAMAQAILTEVHRRGGRGILRHGFTSTRTVIAAPAAWDHRAATLDLLNAPTHCSAGFGGRPETTGRIDHRQAVNPGYIAWADAVAKSPAIQPESGPLLPSVIIIREQPTGHLTDEDAAFAAWALIVIGALATLPAAMVALPFLVERRQLQTPAAGATG